MSNRILNLSQPPKVAYITAGDPDIATTEKLILELEATGANIIEIGVPFSDPIAANPAIQAAEERALLAGFTVDKLFAMVMGLRPKTTVALVLSTYANPIFAYGTAKFMAQCQAVGVDGVVVTDAPFEEMDEFAKECEAHQVCLISVLAPTSPERLKKIALNAKGYLRCVSSPSGVDAATLVAEVAKFTAVPCVIH